MLNDRNSIQASEIPDNNPPLNQSSNDKIIYYCYDKNGNYMGLIYSNSQPTDSTTKTPTKPHRDESGKLIEGTAVGMANPRWNGIDWVERTVVSKEQRLAQLILQ